MHELRVTATTELHLNATYVGHIVLKIVHEKSQSVMDDNLLFFWEKVFDLAQRLRDSKTSDLNY